MDTLISKIEKNYSKLDSKHIVHLLKTLQIEEGIRGDQNFSSALEFGKKCAEVLVSIKMDMHCVVAGLFANIQKKGFIKDSKYKLGKDVQSLLEDLERIDDLKYKNNEADPESLRGMFVSMAKDIRVIILKLAKVLTYTRNPEYLESKPLDVLMAECKKIYAPLSVRLGLTFIKNNLELEIFKYYSKEEYEELLEVVHAKQEERKIGLNEAIKEIQNLLKEHRIKGKVYGRIKELASIYKKVSEKDKDLEDIYDLCAVRVLVNNVNQCYMVLANVHALYTPIPDRFKDYIAKPKANGYQSLHTSVIGKNGEPIEVQIRTLGMHNHAEYGVAAHFLYKEKKAQQGTLDERLTWVRRMLENEEALTTSELLQELESDDYKAEIFVQTPVGKILSFAEDATALDFAYRIHSKVGHSCIGCKINDKMVPISTVLQNGDKVEIIRSKTPKAPSRDWLKIVTTAGARSKINQYFRKNQKEDNIKKGKSILEQAAKDRGLTFSKLLKEEWLQSVFERYSLNSVDDMYASVGYGGLKSNQILNRLTSFLEKENKERERLEKLEAKKDVKPTRKKPNSNAINITGLSNIMVRFAKCCSPVPGDDIKGFVSVGKGVTIHRADCENLNYIEKDRFIDANWNETSKTSTYVANLIIVMKNSRGALATISAKIAEGKLNINNISSTPTENGMSLMELGISIENKQQLENMLKKIKSLPEVYEAYRS